MSAGRAELADAIKRRAEAEEAVRLAAEHASRADAVKLATDDDRHPQATSANVTLGVTRADFYRVAILENRR